MKKVHPKMVGDKTLELYQPTEQSKAPTLNATPRRKPLKAANLSTVAPSSCVAQDQELSSVERQDSKLPGLLFFSFFLFCFFNLTCYGYRLFNVLDQVPIRIEALPTIAVSAISLAKESLTAV